MNIGNNIGNIMKITGAWNTFKSNHPKFPASEVSAVAPGFLNLKVKDSDLKLLKQLSDLKM